MNVVENIRKFIRRGSAEAIDQIPEITIVTRLHYWKSFTSPNPDVYATFFNKEGAQVGHAKYAVSPLFDRVYVFNLGVTSGYRRKGYASALLRHLSKTYDKLPITAVKELESAYAFWDHARRLENQGIVVTAELSATDMDKESLRWRKVFQADIARLELAISERFLTLREPWEIAVGRGLE